MRACVFASVFVHHQHWTGNTVNGKLIKIKLDSLFATNTYSESVRHCNNPAWPTTTTHRFLTKNRSKLKMGKIDGRKKGKRETKLHDDDNNNGNERPDYERNKLMPINCEMCRFLVKCICDAFFASSFRCRRRCCSSSACPLAWCVCECAYDQTLSSSFLSLKEKL